MAGVLTKSASGLILAEPCDNTPATDGWTTSIAGTTKSVIVVSNEAAHSGSNSWDFQIAQDWSPSAFITLTKSVTIPGGGHPLLRCFRGLNVKGAAYDDFLGSALNQFGSRWSGGAAVGNSLATVSNTPSTDSPITSLSKWIPTVLSQNVRLCARFQIASGFKGSFYAFYQGQGWSNGTAGVQTNYNGDAFEAYTEGYSIGAWGLEAIDGNMHVYEVQLGMDATYKTQFWYWFYIDGTLLFGPTYTYVGGPPPLNADFRRLTGGDNIFLVDFLSDSYPSAYMCSLTLG